MRYIFLITIFLSYASLAQELKIKADVFSADEAKGISIFNGSVNIQKGDDELNASKVIVYTDKQRKPIKFVATHNVSFTITTKEKSQYEGVAQKVIYKPQDKEYHFYGNVHLKQLADKKEILGDEVILNIADGKAYAKGLKKEPVIMIFDIKEEE